MIQGRYFDGTSALCSEATLEFGMDGQVHVHGATQAVVVPVTEVTVSDRIANITRRVHFPGGAVFETQENDAVDQACAAAGIRTRYRLVHWLESRWPVAAASLVAVALLSFGFVRWGVPAIAGWAARAIPTEMDSALGSGTLEVLDSIAFRESRLSSARSAELSARFAAMTTPLDDGHRYELVLRRGGPLGANAFALPSGIVVLTDELVELAENDEEIVAVLAHEIGHVRGRHALRHLLQAAGVSAIAVALLGDLGSVSALLTAAPALLHAKHSRDFEREADGFAKDWLRENGVAESHWDAIMCRMAEEFGESESSAPSLLSTHPATGERARCDDQS